jgi:hypothetical protein
MARTTHRGVLEFQEGHSAHSGEFVAGISLGGTSLQYRAQRAPGSVSPPIHTGTDQRDTGDESPVRSRSSSRCP